MAAAQDPKFILYSSVETRGQALDPYDGVSLDILDDGGNVLDETLNDVLASLDKQGWNAEHMTMLDVSYLSNRKRRLSARRTGRFIEGLSDRYVFTDIVCASLSNEALSFAYLAAVEGKKKLNLKVTSPGFERYVLDYAGTDPKLARSPHRWIVADTTDTLAGGDAAFALGAALNIPVWDSSDDRNLVLYREARDVPEGFVLDDEAPGLREEILGLRKARGAKEAKPVADLVLAPSKDPAYTFTEFIGGAMSALSANGYDVRVTFETLLDKADLYYVIGRDDWLENLPFFKKITALMDSKLSKFYGPVILHPTGRVKESGPWADIRAHFKIPMTETGWIGDIPAFVKEKGRDTAWGGGSIPAGAGMTFIRAKEVQDAGGDVLLSGLSNTQTVALILRNGNHFLVNGAPLPREADYILSKLAGGALREPAPVAVSAGRKVTAAYALDDARLILRLPMPEPPPHWREIIYGRDGRRGVDKTIPGTLLIKEDLLAGELLVLLAVSP